MARLTAAVLGAASLLGGREASAALLRSRPQPVRADPESYSFAEFNADFRRGYAEGSEEFQRRSELFQASLAEVRATNARNARERHPWKAGVHPFMDWTQEERGSLNGYKPPRSHRRTGSVSLLHSGARALGRAALNTTRWEGEADWGTGGLDASTGPAMRNQGNCGSCWAISAVEAVEAQLQRSGGAGAGARLSAQALVDCVPNPQHCGGTGGCDGATGELAYAFMRDYGIPLEADVPYRAKTLQCPENPLSGAYPARMRARVAGWSQLPSNQAKPLMEAITQQGPVVVAVDGNSWFNYDSGVFDGCDRDATLGHAVLAKGFGQDAGNKYWLIQNSWGESWGEQGHIRLLRHEDEDSWCGTDRKPQEGVGCDGGPSEVTVCGACGLLYDPVIPQGVRLESGDGAGSTSGASPHVSIFEAAATLGQQPAAKTAEEEMDVLLRHMESKA